MITVARRSGAVSSQDVAERMLEALKSPVLKDYCREQLRASRTPEEQQAAVKMIAEIVGTSR